ncbi:alpha/beta fold hydrolase [Clostridium sp. DJ247]|uniref:alpha/beta fold hydrolase n=1 Tax=Clostridium sp. DJ247 TaxID=2726188 RepID=UPI0016246D24|nr:alpha/beta hydrolase [Clostridium sp. DJ247]MBC2580964.1 alpha/beta fold hydrolase [Clostridium sp. DJ247]
MNKPYLVMLPGWGMKGFVFEKISEFLSKDFELVFVEWDTIHSIDEFKQRVLAVIEQKHLTSFSLLGWSLGSLVAQDIVLDTCWNVNNLILIGGTSCFVQHKEDEYNIGWNKRIVERMKFQLNRNPKETLFNFNSAMFSKAEKQKKYDIQFLQMIKDNIDDQSVDSLILGLDYLIEKDLRSKLPHINIPLLIIHGEEDSICPLEAAVYIKNRVSHCHLEIIRKAGHIPFFTSPSDCYNAISHFIL